MVTKGLISLHLVCGGIQLLAPDVGSKVDDLPLQVGKIDHVEIHQADPADSGRRQIQCQRCAEPSGPDQQHARLLQLS